MSYARFWIFSFCFFSPLYAAPNSNPIWYDVIALHDVIHNMDLTLFQNFQAPFSAEDHPNLGKNLQAVREHIDNIHTLLEADPEESVITMTKAVERLGVVLEKFALNVRQNHLKVGSNRPHADATISLLGYYAELRFWLTPVNP